MELHGRDVDGVRVEAVEEGREVVGVGFENRVGVAGEAGEDVGT